LISKFVSLYHKIIANTEFFHLILKRLKDGLQRWKIFVSKIKLERYIDAKRSWVKELLLLFMNGSICLLRKKWRLKLC